MILPFVSMLPNTSTWRTFYDAPAGEAFISLSNEGYRVVGGSVDRAEPPVPVSSFNSAATAAVYLAHTRIPIPSFLREPLPLTANLSSTWEVLIKPSSETLLHCRLPFPLTMEEVRAREANVLQLYGAEMADALQQWWWERAGSQGVYGEGEQMLTDIEQWYIVCPFEGVYRVNSGSLRSAVLLKEKKKRQGDIMKCHQGKSVEVLHRTTLPDRRDASGNKKPAPVVDQELELQQQKMEDRMVKDFMTENLRCSPSFYRLLREDDDPVFQAAFSRLGEFDWEKSRPQWNPTLRSWEMWYPSTQRCTELSSSTVATTTAPVEYFWRTRVLLKCFRERGSPIQGEYHDVGTDRRPRWQVTEVRQRCLLEVELSSDLVCLWDDYLDQLNVNPIPCVELS